MILDRASGRIHQLNQTATFVWRRCDGSHRSADIVAGLVDRFDVRGEIAADDVERILAQFDDLDLLQ